MKRGYGMLGAVLVAASLGAGPAMAQTRGGAAIVVSHDMGGSLRARQDQLRQLRRSGGEVRVLGACYSACTMYLGLSNVCVAPGAVLGFHGPRGAMSHLPEDAFEHWSRVMARDLRAPLREWFMATARHAGRDVIRVSGAELIRIGYRQC